MADVTMPKLSDTMEEGKILRWLKQAGDTIAVGDLLVEVETDKADMEVEASAAGVLREVKLGEGESAPVGAVIAVIDGDGSSGATPSAKGDGATAARPKESAAPAKEAPPAKEPAPAKEAPPAAKKPAAGSAGPAAKTGPPGADEEGGPTAEAAPPARAASGSREAAPARAVTPARTGAANGSKATPLARALADEIGVDLASLRGTGPAGRITRHDVEQAAGRAAQVKAKPPAPAAKAAQGQAAQAATEPKRDAKESDPSVKDGHPGRREEAASDASEPGEGAGSADAHRAIRRVPLSKMRASIARRMTESKREAPHFYLTTVVDMDEAVRLRAQLKALEVSRAGVTYNHMVLKAVAGALAEYPEVNARFAGDAIEVLGQINLGIATAVEDGLIVPVLAGADQLSLLEIAEQARALADKAEAGRFTSADLSGATFSVSNLGMFDVDSFSAVINPPQAAILAVGSVKQRPVVREGALAVGFTMALTLSCDHRVVDGARGGRFLAEVKRRLESPASLLLPREAGA